MDTTPPHLPNFINSASAASNADPGGYKPLCRLRRREPGEHLTLFYQTLNSSNALSDITPCLRHLGMTKEKLTNERNNPLLDTAGPHSVVATARPVQNDYKLQFGLAKH